METTYYTLTAREILVERAAMERASGDGARQLVCVRKAAAEKRADPAGKVIDLAAWKAERREEALLEEQWYADVDGELDLEEEPEHASRPEPRARRGHGTALTGELLASLSVVGAMVLLAVRILGGI